MINLLKNLYCINSPSGHENYIRKYIISQLPADCTYFVDKKGNLLVERGNGDRPCIVAHMDEVHNIPNRTVLSDDKIIIAHNNGKQCGIGGDDKNGIAIALIALRSVVNLKACFFVEEETGGGGSDNVSLKWFKNVLYLLQFDRRGNSDLITSISFDQIASDNFISDLLPIVSKYGYSETSGLFTDVYNLFSRGVKLSAVNISCGYYNAHSDGEYTNIADVKNALALCLDVLMNLTQRYTHKKETKLFPSRYWNNSPSAHYWDESYNRASVHDVAPNWRKNYYSDVSDHPCNTCQLLNCMECNRL
jgi:hypothetical protein